jgi:NTE family protein
MKKSTPKTRSSANEECILVLQGGGALGAYQAGVYEVLERSWHSPSWIAGISIGAINAALIAGNPPERRVERMREFWNLVSSQLALHPTGFAATQRNLHNEASASLAILFGLPGFFSPRFPAAPFQPQGTTGSISYYDTTPLLATLERLVDFDLLNSGKVRLSVGAVNVRSGNFRYFDTAEQRIDARHIMASGALPPGFPPIEIDGEYYWDGGLVSNTPLQYVLDQPGPHHRLVFQVDLFSAQGPMPANLAQVSEREKEIRFSSRTRLNTDSELQKQAIAQAARRLMAKLPNALKKDPDALALLARQHEAAVSVVHLIYRSKKFESQSKDYEFSRASMEDHWQAGSDDMAHTLRHAIWTGRKQPSTGVHTFDLTADGPRQETTVKT